LNSGTYVVKTEMTAPNALEIKLLYKIIHIKM